MWTVCDPTSIKTLNTKGSAEIPWLAILCEYCHTLWQKEANIFDDSTERGYPEAPRLHPS